MTVVPRRGDGWLAELDETRPVIVLTRNPVGRCLDAVRVAAVTSTVRGAPTEVPVGPADGVRVESAADMDNTQLLARTRLERRLGRAAPQTMSRLWRALSVALLPAELTTARSRLPIFSLTPLAPRG